MSCEEIVFEKFESREDALKQEKDALKQVKLPLVGKSLVSGNQHSL